MRSRLPRCTALEGGGIVAILSSQFSQALVAIEPSADDKTNAPEAHNAVRAALTSSDDLKDWDLATVLIGSYKRDVSIRRVKDVDVFCRMEDIDSDVDPSTVLNTFHAVLDAEFGTDADGTKRVTRQARSIAIEFPDLDGLHVDAVPARKRDDGNWEIPTRDGDWQATNPERLTELKTAMNLTYSGDYVPLVKLVRQTRRTVLEKRPGGLFAEMALYDACLNASVSKDNLTLSYVTALEAIADYLDDRVSWDRDLPDPTMPGQNLTFRATDKQWETARDKFRAAATTARTVHRRRLGQGRCQIPRVARHERRRRSRLPDACRVQRGRHEKGVCIRHHSGLAHRAGGRPSFRMTPWEESIDAATFQFIEQMERRGFRANGRSLIGPSGGGADAVTVQVTLPDGFPFTPPVVAPQTNFPKSWHRELDGAMCLYSSEGRENLPWLSVDEFMATVNLWITESTTGWTNDFPDLDLDRYYPQIDEPLLVYGDLDALNNKFIQLRHLHHLTRVVGPGSIPNGKGRHRKDRSFGFVTDIGDPDSPPTSWADLAKLIPAEDATAIESAVGDQRLSHLVVRYSRNGVGAAVVLKIWQERLGNIALASVRSASEAPRTITLRAGLAVTQLADVRVAVVGVGAIGSFVCDLLARSGVGRITAYDTDIVRPGNLIRHLADDAASVGLSKPVAIKGIIEGRPFNPNTTVRADGGCPSPRDVMALFSDNNLVIDATAAGDTTNLLGQAALAGGHRLLTVCLQEEGSVVRVDIVPPLKGDPLPATVPSPRPSRESLRFEAGCGDPVSQTPAFAVYEAAAIAARHAIGLLTRSPVSDAGTFHDYR